METTQTLTEVDKTVEFAPLVIADRCDRCPAQAFVAVHHKTTGHSLMFCGHHFGRNDTHFIGNPAWIIQDETHKINTKPSVSANAD